MTSEVKSSQTRVIEFQKTYQHLASESALNAIAASIAKECFNKSEYSAALGTLVAAQTIAMAIRVYDGNDSTSSLTKLFLNALGFAAGTYLSPGESAVYATSLSSIITAGISFKNGDNPLFGLFSGAITPLLSSAGAAIGGYGYKMQAEEFKNAYNFICNIANTGFDPEAFSSYISTVGKSPLDLEKLVSFLKDALAAAEPPHG